MPCWPGMVPITARGLEYHLVRLFIAHDNAVDASSLPPQLCSRYGEYRVEIHPIRPYRDELHGQAYYSATTASSAVLIFLALRRSSELRIRFRMRMDLSVTSTNSSLAMY